MDTNLDQKGGVNMSDSVSAEKTGRKRKIYTLTVTAVMTAVTCILAPISISIGVVPISFTNLAIYLSLYLLAGKWALSVWWFICLSA